MDEVEEQGSAMLFQRARTFETDRLYWSQAGKFLQNSWNNEDKKKWLIIPEKLLNGSLNFQTVSNKHFRVKSYSAVYE